MTDTRFTVLLLAQTEPALKLPVPEGAWGTFNYRKSKMTMAISAQPDGVLKFKVNAVEKDIAQATSTAFGQAVGISTFLSFWTKAAVSRPVLFCAWDSTEGRTRGDAAQYIHGVPIEPPPRLEMEKESFASFWSTVDGKSNEFMQTYTRSMRWYRRGLETPNPIDRFLFFWIGLETLDTFLKPHFNASDEWNTCPDCGAKRQPKGLLGVRALIADLQDRGILSSDSGLFRKMKVLRGSIVHGGARLVKLEPQITELNPTAERILDHALFMVMDLTRTEDRDDVKHELSRASLRVDGTISAIRGDLSLFQFQAPLFSIDPRKCRLNTASPDSPQLLLSVPVGAGDTTDFEMKLIRVNLLEPDGITPRNQVSVERT